MASVRDIQLSDLVLDPQHSWKPQVARTPFSATTVAFNPGIPNLFAVGTGQNFGIAGKGFQHVYSISPASDSPKCRATFLCEQTVLDCQWSEASFSILGAGLGNGDVVLWDVRNSTGSMTQERPSDLNNRPLLRLKGHTKECSSIEWNLQLTRMLITASWDLSVRLWDISTQQQLIRLPGVHRQAIHKATWCPSQPTILATGGGDGFMRILDVREDLVRESPKTSTVSLPHRAFATKSVAAQLSHEGEVLSIDWNKFSPFIIATSGSDNMVYVWDIRKLQSNLPPLHPHRCCLFCLSGHSLAVRSVQWSPFRETILASGSYDMTVCIWESRPRPLLQHRYFHHSEFVIDLDWSLLADGLIASASWDRCVGVWDAFSGNGPSKLSK